MLNSTVSPREWRYVALFALAILCLVSVPYLVGLAAQTEQSHFGGFMFGVDDGDTYLAKMRQGANGEWLFRLRYTGEAHSPVPFYAPHILLGKIAGLFARDGQGLIDAMLLVYHGARLVFSFLLILVLYRFVAVFIRARRARWLALALVTLGGGLGWLQAAGGAAEAPGLQAIDLFVPEGFTFYLLYGLPHLSLARAALFGGLLCLFRGTWRGAILAGLCWFVMALCVPFYVGVLGAVLGAWGLVTWLRMRRFPRELLWRCVVASVLPGAYLAVTVALVNADPALRVWQAQLLLPSPHPLQFLFSYGLYVLLTLPALAWAWKRGGKEPVFLLLPTWPAVALALAYLPLDVQRRFIEGAFVPLCILAASGLWLGPFTWLRRRAKGRAYRLSKRAVPALAGIAALTLIMVLTTGILTARTVDPASRLFHAADELSALDWLDAYAAPDVVVLAQNPATASYLPARTDQRAYYGHGVETVDAERKIATAARFFAGQISVEETPRFLADGQIAYVLVGPDTARPGVGLTEIHRSGRFILYEVRTP